MSSQFVLNCRVPVALCIAFPCLLPALPCSTFQNTTSLFGLFNHLGSQQQQYVTGWRFVSVSGVHRDSRDTRNSG